MKTNETSTRHQALVWWNNLNTGDKEAYCLSYRLNKYSERSINYHSLTSREIEEIWLKEMQNISEERTIEQHSYKTNQKQFKQFDESLFKAYISKFSDEDKYEMLRVIAESFKLNFEFNNSFTSIWNNSLK
jgi:hypothetical protein